MGRGSWKQPFDAGRNLPWADLVGPHLRDEKTSTGRLLSWLLLGLTFLSSAYFQIKKKKIKMLFFFLFVSQAASVPKGIMKF